jgi:hypothetical protein
VARRRCPGSTTTIDATLQARDGEIGVAPDLPLGSLSTVKVFSAPGSTPGRERGENPRWIGLDRDRRDQLIAQEDFDAGRRL